MIIYFAGCGYQLGLVGKDTSIQNVYCYTVKNKTRIPGVEMHLTNAIIHALQQYGEHIKVVKNKNEADTFLYVEATSYERSPARFNEADFLQQSIVVMFADIYLFRADVEEQIKRPANKSDEKESTEPIVNPFFKTTVSADSRYFIEPNQPEGENSIRPQLFDKLAREIVHQMVNRWSTPSNSTSSPSKAPVVDSES
jgi:hypothetical protein